MDAGKILTHCSPIVENIFKYLCARDLSNCAQVCKMWNNMSETENKRRLFMEWFLQVGDEDHYHGMLGCREKCFVQEYMLDARAKAAMCFCLLTTKLVDRQALRLKPDLPPFKRSKMGKYERTRHQLVKISDHFLKPCLPTQCQLFCVSSAGIIGCNRNQKAVEVEEGAAISGILIPHIPGMEIHHVAITEQNATPEFPKVPIKCLLMFMGPFPDLIQPFVNCCISNQKEKFALGGAMIAASTTGLGSCFAFTGKNVEAASVLIDHSVEDIAAELQSFERTGLLRNQCFCFAFTCIEKGSQLYESCNYESNLFHKTYPNVPLMGVFGYGEIGAYYLPNVDENQQRAKRFGHRKCVRSHSTTFVLVSVKKPH